MSIKLSPLFSDGMVLQRDKEIAIYGCTEPFKTVSLVFQDREYDCESDKNGAFKFNLGFFAAGGPFQMSISDDSETITLKDILIGDVWLCGGQSNMELMMNRVRHYYPDEMENDDYPFIRQFAVQQNYYTDAPKDDLSGGEWQAAVFDNLPDFTAVGYFFAKRIYKRYGVPIGLIAAAVGGTPIAAWMSREMIEDFPDEYAIFKKYEDTAYVEKIQRQEREYSEEYYRQLSESDTGLNEGWYKSGFDDSSWDERELTSPFTGELTQTGSVWFRKTIEIPKELWGKPASLFFGTVVDADQVYVNGEFIGETTYRYPPREYQIKALPEGKCVIAIRLLNYYGEGGFTPDKSHYLICGNSAFDLDGIWKYRRAAVKEPHIQETFFNRTPSGLYNGMIAPLHNFKIKGVIWYQGETDTGNPDLYFEKFKTMICGWRNKWGYDFPFLFAGLSYYEDKTDWEPLRKQQRKTLSVINTGMAFISDAGEYNDLHPQNKQAVGFRLAGVAFRVAYNEQLPPSPFEIPGYTEG